MNLNPGNETHNQAPVASKSLLEICCHLNTRTKLKGHKLLSFDMKTNKAKSFIIYHHYICASLMQTTKQVFTRFWHWSTQNRIWTKKHTKFCSLKQWEPEIGIAAMYNSLMSINWPTFVSMNTVFETYFKYKASVLQYWFWTIHKDLVFVLIYLDR